MFIENIQEEFYNVIKGKHVLLFVNYDVDAVCTCRILQSFFRTDSTLYTTVSVEGVEDLKRCWEFYKESSSVVVLVNCGGTIDIVETLQPDDDSLIFVLDSHKPTDVCNIYSRTQVRIIGKAEDDENIPRFEELFNDEETEDEDDEDDFSDEARAKRRERKDWEETRAKVLFEYTKFSFHGRASALVAFEMIWRLGKDSLESLWWALVALTYQTLLGLIVERNYTNEIPVLQLHLTRLMPVTNSKVDNYKIVCQKDLNLALYRHWTVQSSLQNSLVTATKLKLWSQKGHKRLRQLLAEMGLPICESEQTYACMKSELKSTFLNMIESIVNNYDLDNVICQSFILSMGYINTYQASDYVYSLVALLNTCIMKKSSKQCFLTSLDALSKSHFKIIDQGIKCSKDLLKTIMKLVHTLIEMKQIVNAGPFLYFVLEEGSVDSNMFSSPISLYMLARYTLKAFNSASRNRRTATLPLIASSPSKEDCFVLGIPPSTEIVPRNFFGKAFEQIIETNDIAPIETYFDSSVIKISKQDRTKFLESLVTILR